MSSSTGAEPLSIVGITTCALTAALEFLDVNSGAIVALGSIIGAICAVIGVYKGHKKDKQTEWIDTVVKKPKDK